MLKKALLTVALATTATLPALAVDFGNTQTMSVDTTTLRVAETSIRLLGNDAGTGAELVEDITDGLGKKQAGYKMMIMSRTYSTTAETRPPREGDTNPRDTLIMHRGTKLIVGVPVVKGKMDIKNAKLLEMGVVSDINTRDNFKPEDKIRPQGEQLVTETSKISNPTLKVTKLELPTVKNGKGLGGGVALEASAEIDGKKVSTSIDNNFNTIYVVKPRAAGAFKADSRFISK